MNTADTNITLDTSCSDNSHIFGIPMRISEGYDGFMDIPIIGKDGRRSFEELGEWIEKVRFLQKAGIEMHLMYKEAE